ncbi:unnamed protein product, partial [Amoebophrya sp. A25]
VRKNFSWTTSTQQGLISLPIIISSNSTTTSTSSVAALRGIIAEPEIKYFNLTRGRTQVIRDLDWLRASVDFSHRRARRDIAVVTQAVAEAGGYVFYEETENGGYRKKEPGSAIIYLKNVEWSREQTNYDRDFHFSNRYSWPSWRCGLGRRPSRIPNVRYDTSQHLVTDLVFTCGRNNVRGGGALGVVNPGNRFHPGGGFVSGGRHALEEALCTQSTLFSSLQKVADAVLRGKRSMESSRNHDTISLSIPSRSSTTSSSSSSSASTTPTSTTSTLSTSRTTDNLHSLEAYLS